MISCLEVMIMITSADDLHSTPSRLYRTPNLTPGRPNAPLGSNMGSVSKNVSVKQRRKRSSLKRMHGIVDAAKSSNGLAKRWRYGLSQTYWFYISNASARIADCVTRSMSLSTFPLPILTSMGKLDFLRTSLSTTIFSLLTITTEDLEVVITPLLLKISMIRSGMITMVSVEPCHMMEFKLTSFSDSSVSEVRPEQAVTKAAYLLFYRRRSTSPLGPPYLQQLVTDHYFPTTDSEPAGEDQRPDGSASHNGSSSNSLPAAVGAHHLPGLSAAGRGPASQVRSASKTLVSADYDSDEGISMAVDDEEDNDLPSYDKFGPVDRKLSAYSNAEPGWGWGSVTLGGGAAELGSDNEMEDGDTLNGGASDVPAVGSEDGGTPLRDRMADFGDESRMHSYEPTTPESDGGAVKYVEHVTGVEVDDSDGEVTEVRVDDEEGV